MYDHWRNAPQKSIAIWYKTPWAPGGVLKGVHFVTITLHA